MKNHKEKISELISQLCDDDVSLGDPQCDLVPTLERIRETENVLGCSLPPDYMWFLSNNGGGEVSDDEIFLIYPKLTEKSIGDIVCQVKWFRDRKLIDPTDIVVCSNDFGEIFYFDTDNRVSSGEFPIFVRYGKIKELYVENFLEFLYRILTG